MIAGMNRFYAGIGSRETPQDILSKFEHLGWALRNQFILRSGGADGADKAFEKYVPPERKEIFIPKRGFNGNVGGIVPFDTQEIFDRAYDIARDAHPNWGACNQSARAFHMRNVAQVLGNRLDEPVEFVLCWTKGGKGGGGTGQAIRIAKSRNIPVLDFGTGVAINVKKMLQIVDSLKD